MNLMVRTDTKWQRLLSLQRKKTPKICLFFAIEPGDSGGECTSCLDTSGSQMRAYPPREWTVVKGKKVYRNYKDMLNSETKHSERNIRVSYDVVNTQTNDRLRDVFRR